MTWTTHFRYEASKRTLAYVDHFTWWRVFRWLRKKHPTRTWKYIRQRYSDSAWELREAGVELFRPSRVKVERYRYRGTRILLPWMDPEELGDVGPYAETAYDEAAYLEALQDALLWSPRDRDLWRAGCAETCMSGSEGGCGETESG